MASDITYIIDMDGFYVNRKFHPKEVAIMDITTREVTTFYFKVNFSKELTTTDKKSIWYVTNLVHGLKHHNEPMDLPPEALNKIINQLQEQKPGRWAYKGGIYERDLLRQLNIPDIIDLEYWGCPKINILREYYDTPNIVLDLCNRHTPLRSGSAAHCPAEEVYLFYRWIMAQPENMV